MLQTPAHAASSRSCCKLSLMLRTFAHAANSRSCSSRLLLMLQIEDGSLGSPPAERILHELQPFHWFSAHLHVKYAAVVPHSPQQQASSQGRGQKRKSPSRGVSPPPGLGRGGGKQEQGGGKFTKFLALDKCLPRRGFLQVSRPCRGPKLVMLVSCAS